MTLREKNNNNELKSENAGTVRIESLCRSVQPVKSSLINYWIYTKTKYLFLHITRNVTSNKFIIFVAFVGHFIDNLNSNLKSFFMVEMSFFDACFDTRLGILETWSSIFLFAVNSGIKLNGIPGYMVGTGLPNNPLNVNFFAYLLNFRCETSVK